MWTTTKLGEVIAGIRQALGEEPRPAVKHEDPFRVLIGTVLSARTRDENTVKATKNLFSKYKTPEDILKADVVEIEKLIRPAGFYRVKARRIQSIAKKIVEDFDGKTPETLEELLTLPGVGRKTANCVLVYGYRREAIPVDVHVHRIANRLGWVKTRTPEQTEQALKKVLPRKFWSDINGLLVRYGQKVCLPKNPRCELCQVKKSCEHYKNMVSPPIG